jgi:hypothetical protein
MAWPDRRIACPTWLVGRSQEGHTGRMDRERAEAYLRQLAEDELGRAVRRLADDRSQSQRDDAPARSANQITALLDEAPLPAAVLAVSRGWTADRAVSELDSMYHQSLVELSAQIAGDVQVAEEVVRDSFAALHSGWRRVGSADRGLEYLRHAVVNRSRSILRGRQAIANARAPILPDATRNERLAPAGRVAWALTAVGALDYEVAKGVLADYELALGARQAGSRDPAGRDPRWQSARMRLSAAPMRSGTRPAAGLVPAPGTRGLVALPGTRGLVALPGTRGLVALPGTRGLGPTPDRVVRLGQRIPVRGADVSGEVYLLSYAQRASGPQLSLFATAHHPTQGVVAWGLDWPRASTLERFTATDDRGTSYRMMVRDLGGGANGWTLLLDPDPSYDPQWLDLTTSSGEPSVRIHLNPPAQAAPAATSTAVPSTAAPSTAAPSTATAGAAEYLLHAVAAGLLAAHASVPAGYPLPAVDGLGDVIAALQVAGALSPSSRTPGQLAALCASLPLSGHGITEPPARNLPGRWLSLLEHDHRGKTPVANGCAAAATVLPALEGIKVAILGLHNFDGDTVMHVHLSGPIRHGNNEDELYYWPTIWLRDDEGRWHTTRTLGRSGSDGELAIRFKVVPPLSRSATWMEVHAAAPSGEVRGTAPLRWE